MTSRFGTPIAAAALLFGASSAAHAFCGTYVAAAGADVYNSASQVIVARKGRTTTLTLQNDFEGDPELFGMVIPVPSVVDAEHVRVVSPNIFATVDTYSAPRVVEYTCEDVGHATRHTPSLGCTDQALSAQMDGAGTVDEDGLGVTVEAEYEVAEYDIAILSALGAGGLQAWLDLNGFQAPEGGAEVLQGYIDQGSYFLAARVDVSQLPEDRRWLAPLQIRYESDSFGLPVKLGTLNSKGTQDFFLHVLTDPSQGRVAISNYGEAKIEDECMFELEAGQDFKTFYEQEFQAALETEGSGRAAYVTEYSWQQLSQAVKCDPCVFQEGGQPVLLDLLSMGMGEGPLDETGAGRDSGDTGLVGEDIDTGTFWMWDQPDAHYTRIHMRFTPEQIDQDLALYGTGDTQNGQIRYIEHLEELEFVLPVCGEGMVEDPGTCPGFDLDPDRGAACGLPAAPPAALVALVGLVAAARRRREDA